MRKMLYLILPLLGALLTLSTAVSADPATTLDGVYTQAQAEEGEQVYEQFCASCHEKSFYKDKFKLYEGQPLTTLYDVVTYSMPQDNPGGLYLQEYTDVFAYIFSILGYPAGDEPLKHTDGSMDNIIVKTK